MPNPALLYLYCNPVTLSDPLFNAIEALSPLMILKKVAS